MRKRAYKLVSILLVAVFVLCCMPPFSVQAAESTETTEISQTEETATSGGATVSDEVKKALEQDVTDLVLCRTEKIDVRKYNLTFTEYAAIRDALMERDSDLKIARECYQTFVFASDKDGNYVNSAWMGRPEADFTSRYNKVQSILSQLHSEMQGMQDMDKLIYAYNYVVQHTTYTKNAKYEYVGSGSLIEGQSTCGGYTGALLMILDYEGIECKEANGRQDDVGHAWVAVKLDGEWYHIDPTWGDTRSRQKPKTDYRFLLCTDAEFQTAGDTDHGYIYYLPIATSTKYSNWYVHDIVGTMLYDAGYWYYMKDGSIVKNNAQGTAYEVVLQGDKLELVNVKNGVLTYKENGLEKTKTLSAPVHQHTVVVDSAVEATCTKEGKTEGSHCSVCNVVIKAQETVPKKAHTKVTVKPAVEATCKEEGKTAEIQCSVCKDIIQKQETVAKKEHTEEIVKPAVEATCKEEGKTAEIQCSVCKDIIQKQETVEKKEHTIVIDEAVEPTTETEGKTEGKHCSVCDEVLVAQEVIPKLTGDNTTGWVTKDGKKYYVNEDGTNKTGWFLLDGNYYYFDANGVMQTGWQKIGGKWYYLNADGTMKTGWLKDGSKWYYFNANGSMKTGWLKDGMKWYYFNADGSMKTGWLKDGTKWYYFDENGTMQTGWLKKGSSWYYFNADGVMQTGWVKDGNSWYYMNAEGVMQTGWVKVEKRWYYFNESGKMVTGWLKTSNVWYYFEDNGALVSGWQKINGRWYFFYSSGQMAADTYVDSYYVNENGEWIK